MIGDVELFVWLNVFMSDVMLVKCVVGIIGFNGKIMVILLVNYLFKSCGVKSIEVGNVGCFVFEVF